MLKKLASVSLVVVLAFVTISLLAKPVQSTVPVQQQADSSFEYAQLLVNGDLVQVGDQGLRVRWIYGADNLAPQFVSIESLNRLLSRKVSRATLGNLLNTIGSQGWELVDVRQGSNATEYWAFKRKL